MTDTRPTRDRLARALDAHPAHLDVEALLDGSRRQGVRLRRRRRAVVGAGAAAAVLVGGGALAGGLPGTAGTVPVAAEGSSAASTVTSDPPQVQAGRDLARGAAAAFVWAIAQETDARTTRYVAQAGSPEFDSDGYYAELEVFDGAGGSQASVQVQPDARRLRDACSGAELHDCRRTRLPDGTQVQTYRERTPAHPDARRTYAEVLRADGGRVTVSSTNGFDEGATWILTRPEPTLSPEQLVRIARRDVWGRTLPQRFIEAGRTLEPFVDHADVAMGTEPS